MDLTNRTFTIIMADDDPDERFLTETAIKDIGFPGSLRFAGDGEELLCYLNQCFEDNNNREVGVPDLIFLDLNMPVKNGWETLMEIKKNWQLQDIPIVIWTTSNNDEDRLKCIEMGADCFMTKPSNYSSLVCNIRSLIEEYCGSNEKGN